MLVLILFILSFLNNQAERYGGIFIVIRGLFAIGKKF